MALPVQFILSLLADPNHISSINNGIKITSLKSPIYGDLEGKIKILKLRRFRIFCWGTICILTFAR